MIASPCIGVCRLDEASGFCLGCFRTGDEIAAWGSMGEEARAGVRATLPARRPGTEAARLGEGGDAPLADR